MAVSREYRDFVLEQLERILPVTFRHMFGGVGIYADGLFFALLGDDRIYLKVDDSTRGDYEARGMGPFKPHGWPMKYFELPGELLEDTTELRPWVEKSFQVALRAHTNSSSPRTNKSSPRTDPSPPRTNTSSPRKRGPRR